MSKQKQVGVQAEPKPGSWVQTERKAHEAWARLVARKPRAAQLLHVLVARMGHQNAVVASQRVLADLMECSTDTVQRAVKVLQAEQWVQVVRIGKGKEAAYVVNDRVAWGAKRDTMRHVSVFSATVLADARDQETVTLDGPDLRKIPLLYPGERQLPTGPGEDPPSQPDFDGMEPDLPARYDPETGEIY